MVNAALPLDTLRACSKDAAAFQQLVDLFERYASEGVNYYRLLADHFPDGIVALVNHDLRFILVNGQGLQSSGLDPQSMRGRRLGEVFSEDIAARDEPHIRAALHGETRSTEVSYQGHHFLVRTLPVRDPEHRIIAAMVVTQDVTERKYLEEQRTDLLQREQEARREAERAVATQQLFLGMISHELRTPLASIKGFASTIMATDVTFELEQMREFAHIINDEADRLTELIDQLLDVVRMQSGTLRISPSVISLDKVIDTAMPQLKAVSSQHPLVMNIPADLPPILADGQRIGQILVNLVGNAAKFSPQHMPITLSVRTVDDFVQVDVTDVGEGIPPSQRTLVFDAFYRIAIEGQHRPGTGLGLAICKGLVDAHDGTIWVEDRPGPGTTIAFTLPRANVVGD
jgi:PAS domain S-box-containing protein